MKVDVVFSSPFRIASNISQFSVEIEKEPENVRGLLHRISKLCGAKIDNLLFERGGDEILAGLMVKVNDQVFTGTEINGQDIELRDGDKVSLLYFVSGG